MMAVIKPTQFSALKLLDPLDQQEEQGEDDDRYGHVKQVVHGAPYVAGHARSQVTLGCGPGGVGRARARPAASDGYQSPRSAPAMAIEPRFTALQIRLNGTQAARSRFLTEPMRPWRPCGPHTVLIRPSYGPGAHAGPAPPHAGPAPPHAGPAPPHAGPAPPHAGPAPPHAGPAPPHAARSRPHAAQAPMRPRTIPAWTSRSCTAGTGLDEQITHCRNR